MAQLTLAGIPRSGGRTASEPEYVDQGATFDPERVYRYRLWRTWERTHPRVLFVMCNPSTADEHKLDPTLRRCLGFARAWGCGGFDVANIFSLRSTDPKKLYEVEDPVGPNNDHHLAALAAAAHMVIAAWGCHGELMRRAACVECLLAKHQDLHVLKLTKDGYPGHPLYLSAAAQPVLFRARGA